MTRPQPAHGGPSPKRAARSLEFVAQRLARLGLQLGMVFAAGACLAAAPTYDLVIKGGRVMDPESGLDGIRDIGTRSGRIVEVSRRPLNGRETLDARGLVVAPGFIDLHSHAHQTLLGGRVQAFDGVTTAIDGEAGQYPVDRAYAEAARQGRAIHYGYTVSWAGARMRELDGAQLEGTWKSLSDGLRGASWSSTRGAADSQPRIVDRIQQGLAQGAIGVGLLLGYVSAAPETEIRAVSAAAAGMNRPVFAHLRTAPAEATLAEVTRAGASTGAHWYICHVSPGQDSTHEALAKSAKLQGFRVTLETLAWSTGSTFVGAEFLSPSALRARGLTPQAIIASGGPLSSWKELETLRKHRPETLVLVLPGAPSEEIERPSQELGRRLRSGGWVLASDAMPWLSASGDALPDSTWPLPADAWAHPRSASTFLWTIQGLVLKTRQATLMDVVRSASLAPAQAMEAHVPAFSRKGRVRSGADADLIVLDIKALAVDATHKRPARLPRGLVYSIVGGRVLIREGVLDQRAFPGRPIR